jgi:hypothetical protein
MELERRALYNSLRMNWERDPTLDVEPWQVEDYRAWETDRLFDELAKHNLRMNAEQFLFYSEEDDSPEALTGSLILEEVDPKHEDQVYLLVFELWRRLLPERQSLSIFCDELDFRIDQFDLHPEEDGEAIQDALASLEEVLDENTDEGLDPEEAFELFSSYCANDLRSFLYDFIADAIDAGDIGYATDLLEGFVPYLGEDPWFHFLQVRLWAEADPNRGAEGIAVLLEEKPDLGLRLEILEFLAKEGEREQFVQVAKEALPLVSTEADLFDLLHYCADYYHRLDLEAKGNAVEALTAHASDVNYTIKSLEEILR